MRGKYVLPSLVALVLVAAKTLGCDFGPSEYKGPFPEPPADSGEEAAPSGDDSGADTGMPMGDDSGGDSAMMGDTGSGDDSSTDAPSGDDSSMGEGGAMEGGTDAGKG